MKNSFKKKIVIDFDRMYVPEWLLNALEKHGVSGEGKTYLECEAILAKFPRNRARYGHGFDDDYGDDYDDYVMAEEWTYPF